MSENSHFTHTRWNFLIGTLFLKYKNYRSRLLVELLVELAVQYYQCIKM